MLKLTVLAAVLGAAPPPPPKVAALDWNVVDVKPALARFYGDALAQALRQEGLQVVTSQDVAALLGMERQKELLGCSDQAQSCVAELGNALGCDLVLAASVAKLDQSYRGTLKLLSARDGTVKSETSLAASSESALLDEIPAAARRLAAPFVVARPSPGLRAKAWIPAVAGGALAVGAVVGFAVAGSEHAAISTAPDLDTAAGHAATGRTAQGLGWVVGGLAAAALGTAAVFFLTGDEAPAVTPSVSVGPSGAMVGLAGTWP